MGAGHVALSAASSSRGPADEQVLPAVLGGVGGLELGGARERLAAEAHLELLHAHPDQAA